MKIEKINLSHIACLTLAIISIVTQEWKLLAWGVIVLMIDFEIKF